MEAYTSGKVSCAAKQAWESSVWNDGFTTSFKKCENGYVMFGWESQIARCRAMGRGARSGANLTPHKYDNLRIDNPSNL